MKITELIKDLNVRGVHGGDVNREISGLAYDSRKVAPGYAFVCIKGTAQDGHKFIPQAIQSGAAAIIAENAAGVGQHLIPSPLGGDRIGDSIPRQVSGGRGWGEGDVTVVEVEDGRLALAQLAANFYGRPADRLKLVGVTGTNGKTTTTYLIRSILQAAGSRVGLLGTIHYAFGGELIPADRTTPESLDLQQMFARMVENGADYAVMEVSSHALELKRVAGCRFSAAVFTNLTQDHLDFHKDMEHYLAAKQKLFLGLDERAAAVVNMDDPYGLRIIQGCRGRILGYGLKSSQKSVVQTFRSAPTGAGLNRIASGGSPCTTNAWIEVESCKFSRNGIEAVVNTPNGRLNLKSRLMGEYNLYNILSAVGVACALGIAPEVIEKGIARLTNVPGRFETVDCGQPFTVVVDYAHTDDALINLLTMARKLCSGRLITVFGAGGERDRTKRPLMGRAAVTLSDMAVVTSDNPRGEDPMQIIGDIEHGIAKERSGWEKYMVVVDRYQAINEAMDLAQAGDMVVLAGKGHETYQVLGSKAVHFDDREVARQILQQRFAPT